MKQILFLVVVVAGRLRGNDYENGKRLTEVVDNNNFN